MDSNGLSFSSLNLPPGSQIFSFAGANIGDIPKILLASQSSLQDVDHIICNIGINNRDDVHVPDIIQHMQNLQQWCTVRAQKIAWLGILQYANLSREVTQNIKTINKVASDIFKDDFIPSVNSAEIAIKTGDKHKIHYTEKTARATVDIFDNSLN